MPPAALAELRVDTDRRHACEALTDRAAGLGRFDLVLEDGARIVRWAPGVAVLRLTGRWRSGRGRGDVTVDLVGAGPGRTLLSVRLEQPEAWLAASVTEDDVWSVAAHLRELVERRAHPTSPAATISALPVPRSGILPA